MTQASHLLHPLKLTVVGFNRMHKSALAALDRAAPARPKGRGAQSRRG